jgi:group II intron reverse transcriptase/maturase
MGGAKARGKAHEIPKQLVWEAYQRVKANRGAAGVDGESLAAFEKDLQGNLYKVWNRMSSGSYFPPPVKLVEIPKDNGGKRPLGIPTVADRVAQTVVKMALEPQVEPVFHPDSYGYRPGKSALDAVGMARKRCWEFDWVVDLDIKAFFDSLDHDRVERAVAHHTDVPWVRLYISRWLRAPVQMPDGTLDPRLEGTPQGGVVSPLLANLFLHYAFDVWMRRTFPGCPFERFADDVAIHCRSEAEAQAVVEAIQGRFEQCHLELHPTKTRIVYCKDDDRPGTYEHVQFDFLGYTFQPRRAKNRWGKYFVSFLPAMSTQGRQGRPEDDSRVAYGLDPQQSAARGPRSRRQSGRPRLDELLRKVLPVAVCSGPSPFEPGSCSLGAAEVHAIPQPRTSVDALARSCCAPGQEPLCALATWNPARGWGVRAG